MTRPARLDERTLEAFLSSHPTWSLRGGLFKAYRFDDFASPLAFAVRIGMLAEKKDHHPDILLGWGRAEVTWSTHDAGGITALDVEMAEATDKAYGQSRAS